MRIKLKQLFFWRDSIVTKMMLINMIVIGVVIWLVGVSVKDFACLLVADYEVIGEERQQFFNQTMHFYLIRASLVAIFVAVFIYYFVIRKLFTPLQTLKKSTQLVTEGIYPEPIAVASEDEIGQLTRHFNQMIDALKTAENSRKKLLSDVSHELRTPLSNLNGYLEALSTGVITGDEEVFRSLHEESMHLTRLVEQLHELAIWEGKQWKKEPFQSVNMRKLVMSTIQRFQLEMDNKNIRYEVELEEGAVFGDEVGLKQVVANLLNNALQYDVGGWVKIVGVNEKDQYVVHVVNDGQPISADQHEQIFYRFYRTDPSRQRDTGGSGLGLAIAKEIVEQHKGNMSLYTEGHVHTFSFMLPTRQDRRV